MVAAIAFWQSVHKFKTFPPQASDDRSSCTCSDASFILWLFEWQNNWQSAHRKQSAIWCGERCHIKPSDHLVFDTEVASVWDDNYLPGKCSISWIRRTLIPRVNAGAKEKSALFQPVTAGFGIYPRAYKINIRAHELTNRIRKQKKRRTNGECPYFPEELARRQTPKKEWEGCTLIPQMQSLLQTDMSANCLFQDYSVCFSQSREKEITITLFLICFLLLKINYCTVLHHHPSKNDWLFTTHWHK